MQLQSNRDRKDRPNLLVRLWRRYFSQLPWGAALTIFLPAAAGVGFVMNRMIGIPLINFTRADVSVVLVAGLFCFYFLVVAIMASQTLETERRLVRRGQNFWYDWNGKLYNGGEPNIAFRCATYKSTLGTLARYVGNREMEALMHVVGSVASRDFAENLPDVYDRDVQPSKGGPLWGQLDFHSQLDAWMDYDSQTGWGRWTETAQKTGTKNDEVVKINILHGDLLDDEDGRYYAAFLAGYCETVLSEIVRRNTHPAFRDLNTAAYQRSEFPKSGEVDHHYLLAFDAHAKNVP